jgi:hypothetical protein
MFQIGTTEYVPFDNSATSIDPVQSLATSVKIGELLAPGISGRVWRARYLSELCYLIWLSQKNMKLQAGEYKSNYLKMRPFENMMLIAHYLVNQGHRDMNGNIIGSVKVKDRLQNNPSSVKITDEILSNQINLGPLGVHLVALSSFHLVHKDTLELTDHGNTLAEAYARNISGNHERIAAISKGSFTSVQLAPLSEIDEKVALSALKEKVSAERTLLRELLLDDPVRRQTLQDIHKVAVDIGGGEINELMLLDALCNVKSPHTVKYQLAKSFDVLSKAITFLFESLLYRPIEQLRFKADDKFYKSFKFNQLRPSILSEISKIKNLVVELERTSEDPRGAKQSIESFLVELEPSLQSPQDFLRFIIEFHIQHQKNKGKGPWVQFDGENILEITPALRRDEDKFIDLKDQEVSMLHRYRIANLMQMYVDLELAPVVA